MGNFITELFKEFANWGISSIVSILISLVIVAICLPFTYIGYSLRKAIEIRFKKYKGYNIHKYEKHFFFSLLLLLILLLLLYFLASNTIFLGISILISFLIILGLLGLKITFDLEQLFD